MKENLNIRKERKECLESSYLRNNKIKLPSILGLTLSPNRNKGLSSIYT